jgi:N-acetylmuramoyl-L-alanine amidase
MSFRPDAASVAQVIASPNREPRRGNGPDILLLHYTGMTSTDAALERLTSVEARVSSHYLVFEDGRVAQLVPEALRAFHAGVSLWEGSDDINSRSIGIEIGNPGHEFGYPDFPEVQIAAVIALARDILARHGIRADRVIAHSDVAPSRKNDPGEKFPWQRLAAAGVGLWVAPHAVANEGEDDSELALGADGGAVADLQRDLARYGYGVTETGRFDATTRDVVIAFQRHFRPARVDGIADRSTRATLVDLLAAKAGL